MIPSLVRILRVVVGRAYGLVVLIVEQPIFKRNAVSQLDEDIPMASLPEVTLTYQSTALQLADKLLQARRVQALGIFSYDVRPVPVSP